MHCQHGGEVWACFGLLHAYIRFPSGFELFLSSCSSQVAIGLTGGVHRSDRCECKELGYLVLRFDWCRGAVWPVRARLGGALCGFLYLIWWLVLFAWACFCLSCVESLPLPKGTETCLLQVILHFAFPLGCNHLLKFSFSRFFSFPFLFGYQNVCVVNALIKGEIESLYGSRTGGRLLPGVMSNWQCGVDWFLAKYEPARRHHPDLQLRCKSGPRWYSSVSPPLPDREHRRSRQNFGRTTVAAPGDPIASP
jgi:hypothetical protein